MFAKCRRHFSVTIKIALLLVLLAVPGCMNPAEAAKQALQLETAMHEQMTRGDFTGIYNGADQRYRNAVSREKSDALFSSIVRKLGPPLDCKTGGTFVQAATWGTTIKSVCTTTFSKNATGVETFVWIKDGDQYRLTGYHVTSDDLIER
jgi:hypothetical protein